MTTEAAAIVTAQTEQQEAEAQSQEDTASTAEEESTESSDETAEGDASADSTADDNTDGNDTKDSSLETYADFTMPDGMSLDSGLLEQATPLFKELGLNQEQAQKLVDFQAQQIQAGQQGQTDAFNQLKKDWAEQAKNDSEFGGDKFDENISIAKEAISKFGSEGLTKLLDDFGVGNHPEVIRFMTKVGRLTKEDNPDSGGNPVAKAKDRVSILYPE